MAYQKNILDVVFLEIVKGGTPSLPMNHNTIALASVEASLDLQEDLLSVEEEENQPAGENIESMPSQFVPVAIKPFDDAAKEKAIDSRTVDNPLHHVDGNGIHADDSEEESPTPPAFYVDDVIEDGKAN